MLIEKLNWRYATKKMDPEKVVPSDIVERITESIRLAPTSNGLQPFELFVVTNAELRQRIRAASFNQSQITEGSHLLIFAAWDNYTPERINRSVDLMIDERRFSNADIENLRKRLLENFTFRPREENFRHAVNQVYLALGVAIAAAAFEGVDATPMEGFNPTLVDEIVGLEARGLRSVLLLPLGYRDAEKDWLAGLKKVRRSRAEFVTDIA